VTQSFQALVDRPDYASTALSAQDAGVSGVLLAIMPMRMVVMHVVLLPLRR
jgi:hypothetical protein